MKLSGHTQDTYFFQDYYNSVPIGGIIDWWSPTPTSYPTNFAICDGSTITDAESPFYNQATPNFAGGRISYGGSGFSSQGATGGSSTLSFDHSHTLYHYHSMNHGHSGSTSWPSPGQWLDHDTNEDYPCHGNHTHPVVVSAADPGSWSYLGTSNQNISTNRLPPYMKTLKLMRIK